MDSDDEFEIVFRDDYADVPVLRVRGDESRVAPVITITRQRTVDGGLDLRDRDAVESKSSLRVAGEAEHSAEYASSAGHLAPAPIAGSI